MDDADLSDLKQEELLRRQIAYTMTKKPELPATGECYNCEEELPPGARFCDSDCRDDWEKRQ